jgi:cytochrome P450
MAELTAVPENHFNMLDPKYLGGQWKEEWTELAAQCPIFHSDAHEGERGYFVITKYEDIMFVLRNPEIFSSYQITIPPIPTPRPQIPIEIDPPMHRKYRQPITSYFSKANQEPKEAEYREIARALVDAVADKGHCDIANDLTYALPVHSIMSLLNVREEDRAKLVESLLNMTHPPGKEENPELAAQISLESTMWAYDYFRALLPDRRANPGEDVLSLLVSINIDGEPISDDDVLDYTILVCAAGFETTAASMAYGFIFLAQNPDVRGELVADPSLIPNFIEELMRFEQPTKGLARTVSRETEISGVAFKPGDRLLLLYATGNRDPEVFSDPQKFDLRRSPNRHFGFGAGPHVCAGIHMARLEMKVLFEEFLKRIPDFEIDEGTLVEQTGPTYAVTSLPATWRV